MILLRNLTRERTDLTRLPALFLVVLLLAACRSTADDAFPEPTTPPRPSPATTPETTTTTEGTPVTSTTEAAEDPPWLLPAVPLDQVDDVYLEEWHGDAGSPADCPLLVYASLGEQAADATIRRATNEGDMLVAWDLPDGPGHTGDGEPCEDCGRGVVGLGTFQASMSEQLATHEWSDGSRARVYDGWYGTEASLQVEGFGCTYWLWSHLGPEHLEFLFSQLRRVEGLG